MNNKKLFIYLQIAVVLSGVPGRSVAHTKSASWKNYSKAAELFSQAAPAVKILTLCKQALENADDPSLYARASFLKAKVLIREKQFEPAHRTFAELYSGSHSVPQAIILEAKLRDARLYLQENQSERAIGLLQVVSSSPNYPMIQNEARVALAWEYADKRDWQNCDSLISAVVLEQTAYETDERILVLRARTFMAHDKPESAIEILDGTRDKLALTYLAKAFEQIQKPIMAVGVYNKISDLFPDSEVAEKVLFQAGDVFMKAKDWLAAQAQFNRLLQRYPDTQYHAEISFRLGWIHMQLGHYEQALAAFRTTGAPATQAHVTFMEAECLRKMGTAEPEKLQQALLKYNSVTALFPKSPLAALATLRSALTRLQKGDSLNATVSLRQFLSLHPKDELAPAATFLLATHSNAHKRSVYFEQILQKYPQGIIFDAALVALQKYDYETSAYQNVITRRTLFQESRPTEVSNDYQRLHHLILAESAYYLRQYELARKEYTAVADGSKDDLSQKAALGQAWCQLQSGEPEQAAPAFAKLSKTYTEVNHIRASFGLATTYFRMKRYEDAIQTYPLHDKKVTDPELLPLFAKSLYRIGEAYYRLQYYAQAIEMWEKLGQQYPESTLAPEAKFMVADTYFRANHFEKAIAAHENILQNYTTSLQARKSLLQLAQCEYNAGRYDEAIPHFEAFIKAYPEDVQRKDALSGLQLCYYQLGQSDQATEALEKLIAQSPNDLLSADARFQLAMNHLKAKNYEAAIHTFKEILAAFPGSSYAMDAQFALAKAYTQQGNYDNATQEFTRFIQYFSESPQIPEAVFNLGLGYFNLESYLSASDHFQQVVEQYQKSEFYPAALQNLGWCFERLGESKPALEYFERYAREFPKAKDVDNVKLQVARIKAETGRFEEAHTALKKLQKSSEPAIAAEAAYNLGMAYLGVDEPTAAKESFRFAIRKGTPDNFHHTNALSQLAALYESEQDWENAVATYQLLIDSTTDDEWIAAAQERIKALAPFISGSTARATN